MVQVENSVTVSGLLHFISRKKDQKYIPFSIRHENPWPDGTTRKDFLTVRAFPAELQEKLKALAEANDIPYRIDAYQNYGSDASACLKAGKDVRALCFGPAAEATHSYERTHADSIDAALRLLTAYLTAPMVS